MTLLKNIGILFIVIAIAGVILYEKPQEPIIPEPISVGAVTPPPPHTYFAHVDPITKEVLNVIVADQAFIDSGVVGDSGNWIQTYKDGSKRKNGAGKGYTYDGTLDAFIAPKPTLDAILDNDTAKWIVPRTVTATTT